MKKKIIYLDNNATTFLPKIVKTTIFDNFNKGNPSTDYGKKNCKKIMLAVKIIISKKLNFSLDDYEIIFNSGCTESNNTIIRMIKNAYICHNRKATILISNVEHKSLMSCINDLNDCNFIKLIKLSVNKSCIIDIDELRDIIKNTNISLVSIMHVNNETGAINNIEKIGEICKTYNTPFYSDITQSFCKIPINITKYNLDAFGASFHKTYGPPGLGFLVLKKTLIEQYNLRPLISGSQNNNLRGGTENFPYIAGLLPMFAYISNKSYIDFNKLFINKLKKKFQCISYNSYDTKKNIKKKI